MLITKIHDQFHTNNSSIYTATLAYGILFTYLTQKHNKHINKYPRKSCWCPVGRVSRVYEYKRRHTKKQLEKNVQSIYYI
jgi:hypothetical protein